MRKDVRGVVVNIVRIKYLLSDSRRVIASTALFIVFSCGIFSQACAVSPNLAGSEISNTAQIQFTVDAGPQTQASNTVSIVVDEVFDIEVTPLSPGTTTLVSGAVDQVLGFRVINDGNGAEAVELAAVLPAPVFGSGPTVERIVIDANGNGVLDSTDTVYLGPANAPLLAPGQSIIVWMVIDVPAGFTGTGGPSLTATVVDGHGAPKTLFAVRGGVSAVVGYSGGQATASDQYSVTGPSTAQLFKSQVVTDIGGGDRAVSGSTITYALLARFTGSDRFVGASLNDTIPAGTTYVPNSLQLDGAEIADATAISGGAIAVPLGDVSGPAQHTLTFQVRIN